VVRGDDRACQRADTLEGSATAASFTGSGNATAAGCAISVRGRNGRIGSGCDVAVCGDDMASHAAAARVSRAIESTPLGEKLAATRSVDAVRWR
jgi:hypothetical protein